MKIHYIKSSSDGWVTFKRKSNNARVALYEHMKLKFIETVTDKKTKEMKHYFKALEGREKGEGNGKIFYYTQRPGGKQWTTEKKPAYRSPVALVFDITKKTLSYREKKIYAFTDPTNEVPVGTHDLELPDAPHKGGAGYLDSSNYARTWFLIGHKLEGVEGGDGGRYLHTGEATLGCITVDPKEWTELYKYLILSRKGRGDQNIGTVKVIKSKVIKPRR